MPCGCSGGSSAAAGFKSSVIAPQVGFHHRATVTIEVDDTVLRILDQHGQALTIVPRTSQKEVTRYKAHGHTNPAQA